mmetsp:Transcript_55/g.149  ORF Transcript_55/g.149 Transcript_55/m.149 type:complete len:144 (+) Transcript_55:153-584(+)
MISLQWADAESWGTKPCDIAIFGFRFVACPTSFRVSWEGHDSTEGSVYGSQDSDDCSDSAGGSGGLTDCARDGTAELVHRGYVCEHDMKVCAHSGLCKCDAEQSAFYCHDDACRGAKKAVQQAKRQLRSSRREPSWKRKRVVA